MDTTLRALDERVNQDYPESWRPDAAENHPNPLVGEIIGRHQAATRRDVDETVLVVRDEAGVEWSLWLLGAVLQRELGSAKVGDRVAVRWLGMRSNAEGTEYRAYRVALEPTAAPRKRAAKQTPEEAA